MTPFLAWEGENHGMSNWGMDYGRNNKKLRKINDPIEASI